MSTETFTQAKDEFINDLQVLSITDLRRLWYAICSFDNPYRTASCLPCGGQTNIIGNMIAFYENIGVVFDIEWKLVAIAVRRFFRGETTVPWEWDTQCYNVRL